MSDSSGDDINDDREHWFTGKELDVLLYKINRRPLHSGTLFEEISRERMPPNALEHILENLTAEAPRAESGRRHKRTWQIGNVEALDDLSVITWQRDSRFEQRNGATPQGHADALRSGERGRGSDR